MAKGARANKVTATVYIEGLYEIRAMDNGMWRIVDDGIEIERQFARLEVARAWCKLHPADPDYAGKYA